MAKTTTHFLNPYLSMSPTYTNHSAKDVMVALDLQAPPPTTKTPMLTT